LPERQVETPVNRPIRDGSTFPAPPASLRVMKIRKPFLRFALILALPLALAGCQTARMAMPPALEARADSLACEGRNGFKLSEAFTFGPYEVFDVRRGWSSRFTWGILSFRQSSARQKLEYALRAPGGAVWRAQAATGVRQQDVQGQVAGGELTWGIGHQAHYLVRIGRDGSETPWTLNVAEGDRDTALKGVFTDGATTYEVEGSHQLAGTTIPLMDPSGYIVSLGSRPVMAVDVLNAGSVHFAPDLAAAEREPLAAAAAALLLYKDLSNR